MEKYALQKIKQSKFFELLNYKPFDAQQKFHSSRARFKILIAGSRFGKSLAASYEAAYKMLQPNSRGWIVAPTYLLGEKEFRYFWDIFVESLPKLIKKLNSKKIAGASNYNIRSGKMKLILPWKSTVEVKSASNPYTLLGEELDWLILSEASQLRYDIWYRYLRARLITREGSLIIPTTPSGKNWLYKLFLMGYDPLFPAWESWQFLTSDNPYIPKSEIEDARLTMPEDIFLEQFCGKFLSNVGKVYPEFSRAAHVNKDFELGANWRYFRSFDFGYNNATAVLFCALTPDDVLIIFDEYYQRRRTLNEIIYSIQKQSSGYLFEISTADPSSARERAELAVAGIPTLKAPNEIRWGINAVRERLHSHRLIIHPRCKNLIHEFEYYRYPDSQALTLSENPLKENDHALDALRYLVAYFKKFVKWEIL